MRNNAARPNPMNPEDALRAHLLTLLVGAQQSDGGWAFHAGGESRVEPACWAIQAIADTPDPGGNFSRAMQFLASRQLADGSWPASAGMDSGAWITSLACSALAHSSQHAKAVAAGLQWLCDDFPRDSSPWTKFLKTFQSNKHLVAQDDSLRGWGWTPRTSSWVEPTAFALMAFASVSASDGESSISPRRVAFEISDSLASRIQERRALAVALLYDRMCSGGGWNCGNPRVYGVDGDALVLPTCWALLALRKEPEHSARSLSLAWLQREFAKIESAGSLAVALITLETYGLQPPPAKRNLPDWTPEDLAAQGTHVVAWAALALDPARHWPASPAPAHQSIAAPQVSP